MKTKEEIWRRLEKGEIIRAGDEVDACANSWHNEPKWEPARRIGQPAPDPQYVAHSIYRRPTAPDGGKEE
jgi:hypothetical protein